MSVLKKDRKPSQFEVLHHVYKMRREVTDLLLRDFGNDYSKYQNKIESYFGGRKLEQLNDNEKQRYAKLHHRNKAFDEWYMMDERKAIIDSLRNLVKEITLANSIYPTCTLELNTRRIHQDLAIGYCYDLTNEIQYAIETLPVDVNKYLYFADMINKEINLLKAWRKANNKFKRVISDSGANFANVNNNGNANYNNASNSNGVRPDFDNVIK